jgi:hypothetical protein
LLYGHAMLCLQLWSDYIICETLCVAILHTANWDQNYFYGVVGGITNSCPTDRGIWLYFDCRSQSFGTVDS